MTDEQEKPEVEEEPVAEEPQKTDEEVAPSPKSVLSEFEGAPDQATLDDWKAKFGTIFVTAFDVDEIFICRCLDRKTWTKLNREIAENQAKMGHIEQKMFQSGKTELQAIKATEHMEIDQEELTVAHALLWKSVPDQVMVSKGGIVSSLSNAIMSRSRFMPAEIAVALTEEL